MNPTTQVDLGREGRVDGPERSRRALARAEARLRAIFDHAPVLMSMRGLDGRYLYVNPQVADVVGRPAESLVGIDPLADLPPEIAARVRAEDEEIARTRQPLAGDQEFPYPDGTRRTMHIVRYPVLDDTGELLGFGTFGFDISDRNAREAERQRALAELEEAQALAGIGSWWWCPETDEATWSAQMYRIFGRDPALGPATSEAFFAAVHPDDRDRLAAGYREAFGGGPGFELDYRILRPDGRELTLHALGREDPDRPGHYLGTVQDVTHLRAVERELRESQRRLRELVALQSGVFDNAPIGEALVAPDGAWLRVNRALCQIVGYSERELLAMTFQDITHPDDLESDLAYVRELLAGERREYRMDKRYLHRDGHVVWIRLSVSLVRNDDGEPLYFISQIEDITDARAREAALVTSRAQLKAIIDHMPAGVSLRDREGRYELVNGPVAATLGVAPEALIGRGPDHHHPPERVARIAAEDAEILASGEPQVSEYELRDAHGELRTFHVVRYPVCDEHGATIGLGAFSLDITDRKAAERALADRERQLAEAQALSHVGSFEWDLVENRITWSDELCRIAGVPLGHQPTIDDIADRVHPDDVEVWSAQVAATSGRGEETANEFRLIRPGGEVRHVQARRYASLGADGRPERYYGFIQDITERKRSEAALERERRDLVRAQSLARIGSWHESLTHGDPGTWSPQLWEMLGLAPSPEPPTLEVFLELIDPRDRDRVAAALASARERGTRWSGQFRVLTPDGRRLVLAFHHEFELAPDGRPLEVLRTLQDVTALAERDAEEAALARIAKLVAENFAPHTVLAQVAQEVRELFDAYSGAVSRFELSARRSQILAGSTVDGLDLRGLEFDLDGDSASARVFQTGDPAIISGRDMDAYTGLDELTPIAAGTVVAAPIQVAGRTWGTLGLALPAGRTVDGDRAVARLARFTDLVAMGIANGEAWEAMARLASTDSLTGLANHRTFYERLRDEVQRARRYERELSVVIFDLDEFKTINDRFGHPAGDRVLTRFAEVLEGESRDGELVARIGGEEFAWLLPETGRAGARHAAERVRRQMKAGRLEEIGTITVSAGVAGLDGRHGAEELMASADQALYWAKDGGRDTTRVYSRAAERHRRGHDNRTGRNETIASVRALARAIDSKDSSTAQHSERVAVLAEQLAVNLGWTGKRARLLYACGLLHDIGKIGIPDEVLLRPGPLGAEELAMIRRHPEVSAHIAAEVLEAEQVAWVRGHHERWDGRGYPDGLAGEDISDGAQLLALADAWDVMTTSRTYKEPLTLEAALAEVRRHAGAQFAPAAVAALLAFVDPDGA